MQSQETKAKKLQERIKQAKIKAGQSNLSTYFNIQDESVQKELRLWATGIIKFNVDQIHFPKNLEGNWAHPLWLEMRELSSKIESVAKLLSYTTETTVIHINERLKDGPERRAEAKANFIIKYGTEFLHNLRKLSSKSNLTKIRKQITNLQTKQKELLPQLRAVNSEFILQRKVKKEEQRKQNEEALKSGEFWKADRDSLKDYFHPPFHKNYLADVSEEWRAALFVECESVSYKRWDKSWGHKLRGTSRGYLCGIDDNGDEWGHEVFHLYQPYDQYDSKELCGTVEDAMAELFDISESKLALCERQGDLLFAIEKIPEEVELHTQEAPWEVRESHIIESRGLKRNGRYFKSDTDIFVTHTSHKAIVLPAGGYRLYELQVLNAD